MSAISNNFNSIQAVPTDGSNRPVVATNRTGRIPKDLVKPQILDPVTQALENVQSSERGSREKPSVLKFPVNIGTGEVPHVMQFKVFWRFEPRDLKETVTNAQAEAKQKIGDLQTLHALLEGGADITQNGIQKSGLDGEKIRALLDLQNDPRLLKTVNMGDSTIAAELARNPAKAKQLLEQTISSYQSRLEDITTELDNGIGRIGKDQQERSLVLNRLSAKIDNTSAGSAALSYGTATAVAGGGVGLVVAGPPGAAAGTAVGFGVGLVAGAAGVGLAKAFNNDAVYDQMVSIYLPFCTKINNEDTFQYEETDQGILQGMADFAGSPLDTTAQAGYVAADKISKPLGIGGAVGAGPGKVTNPRLEKLFKQKDFRNFSFSWEIYPRNQQESEAIRDIIETFRYHAHPARDSDTENKEEDKAEVILRVPGEFEIKFLSTNPNSGQSGFVENEFFPKIARCALTSVSVDYTPNSLYSSFVNNAPTAMTITLQFSEMGLITREDVSKGF